MGIPSSTMWAWAAVLAAAARCAAEEAPWVWTQGQALEHDGLTRYYNVYGPEDGSSPATGRRRF